MTVRSTAARTRRNLVRRGVRALVGAAAAVRYPGDHELTGLIADLRAGSEEFARLWARHEVAVEPTPRKTFRHPAVGPITVNCDVLEISDRDQQVVFYSAPPGSPAEEALRLRSVLGTQTIMLEDGTAAR
ncbi:MmyB family transcriptional regulator [Amycolatopsis sulphurea]|uniref:MmyB family transcriptional regulator n=1 Tax=Amycolatopsis sulphurea TaxID=76022 RepID=UPI00248264DA|nr:hypothetical protein [Amycolatopsis sulphurea]